MTDGDAPPTARRWRKRYLFGALLAIALIAIGIVWSQRYGIAENVIDDQLSQLGVDSSYSITDFDVAHQRVENLVIGDPGNPDLTVRRADIYLRFGFGYPSIRRIDAEGVRVRGRLVDGALTFGALDQLLPEPTGEPFALPDMELTLRDARIGLATPYGPVGLAGGGSGDLTGGFRGFVAAASPALAAKGCRIAQPRLAAALRVTDRRPEIDGPMTASRIECAERALAIDAPELALHAIFSESFDRWGGEAGLATPAFAMQGLTSGPARIGVAFDGEAGGETRGAAQLRAVDFSSADFGASLVAVRGHYRVRGGEISFDGDAELDNGRVAPVRLASVTSGLRGAEGTPLGPVGRTIGRAAEAAASDFGGHFALSAAYVDGAMALRLAELDAESASGARLVFESGEGIHFVSPRRGVRLDGVMLLAGGGFPEARIELAQERAGAPLTGLAEIAPIDTGNARLRLMPVRFSASADGRTRIVTAIEMSGPLADGRVERLRLPVAGYLGRGGRLAFGEGCVPLRWDRLTVASLSIGASELPLCPISGGSLFRYSPQAGMDGGARIARPRIRARLGNSPLLVAAREFRLPLARPGFAADAVAVRLGETGSESWADIGSLEAGFVPGGVDGRFAGASGALSGIPVRMGDAGGDWRFAGGVLTVDGRATVSSDSPDPLFNPLDAPQFSMVMRDNRIALTGALQAPENGTELAAIDLRHDLGSGRGEAVLETGLVRFDQRLQPSDLTPLVLGIIADVNGLVSGTGTVRWGPEGVTSDGVYQMTDIDLAAPFGPVVGLNGEVRFTDLIGMNTEPGQLATIRGINPGVLVEDGVVRYQLLSANQVAVEGARWPFAGGELVLEPTVLDFGVDRERRLTFRVIGVDAFQFLEARDFENIIATGIFDGTLPMVFDNDGGRIESGQLVSRGTGTFSYTGEISDVNLGVFGSLAFNALELIRYTRLEINFDGAIDGEMVTNVEFTGVSPNLAREGQGFIVGGFTRELAEIPIRFNITMHAPFNQMLYSFRLLDDPAFLVNRAIQGRISRMRAERDVQAGESDDLP
ncbi:intermembrane phospholipid transport protein YdbH family protein [Parasphingopyxis marina]|uniref:YdbH domain-containing protein n=1 Tax=Parasphingopyxis marina TaxID=2761622 RepID=A0A842HZD6_9SPHN|nr:YdbH domain-containing protein [Parasphingopyxis marina]MBC2778225.1 YdbH domain-containing protein [Parasphingopyxis marina]